MTTHTRHFSLSLQPALPWTAILGLISFSALCLLVNAGGILRLAFPAGCFGVGLLLYGRYPLLYLGFAWWVWFLAPLVRRLVDFRGGGWVDPSPVLLAPFLVTLITALTLTRQLPRFFYQGGLPFLLALFGVAYGLLVGLIDNPPMAMVVPLLNWLTPILFGFHLFAHWRDYPAYRENLQRTFLWGVLVTGGYGVLQYLVAPEWDCFWLRQQATFVFGRPEPLGIRVFSTMNSPQPFAYTLTAGLLLLFVSPSPLKFISAGVGYLSLLLSLARSAWLGWLGGLLLFLPFLRARLQMRLIATLLVMAVVVVPLTNVEPFASAINSRFQSLTSINSDVSYNARSEGYATALGQALLQVTGEGLGGGPDNTALGTNDSGLLTILFSLGWLGGLPYMGGLVVLVLTLVQGGTARLDGFVGAAQAIVLGAMLQISLNNIMLGVFGMVLWGFLGIALAGQRYYKALRQEMVSAEGFIPGKTVVGG